MTSFSAKDPVSGAVLIGGLSRRMGGIPKGLLQHEGETLISRLTRRLSHRANQVFLVGPHDGQYGHVRLPIYADVIANKGAPGGVHAALIRAVNEWTLVLSCDLPMVTAQTLEHLVPNENADVVLYESDGRLQPLAALWRRSALPVLESCLSAGSPGFAEIFRHLRVSRLERDPGRELTNINTIEDARRSGLGGPDLRALLES